MKILFYGHRGWIGGQFIDVIEKMAIPTPMIIRGEARVDDDKAVLRELEDHKPTHVILFTGRTHGPGCATIDYLEGRLHENIRDNLYAPVRMALHTSNMDIHLTYLGTGCIFDYDEDHPVGDITTGFKEGDLPNFWGSSYSIVKGCTDRVMKSFKNVLQVRIRMPINSEYHMRNFITKITRYEKICSIPNSMTVLPDLLPVLFSMIKDNVVGTYNLTNPGVISHNEILELYRDMVDPTFVWTNFSIEEQDLVLKSKRSNNCLDTSKLEAYYPDINPIHVAVKNVLKNYKVP